MQGRCQPLAPAEASSCRRVGDAASARDSGRAAPVNRRTYLGNRRTAPSGRPFGARKIRPTRSPGWTRRSESIITAPWSASAAGRGPPPRSARRGA